MEGGEVKQVARGKMTVAARGEMMQVARGKMMQVSRGKIEQAAGGKIEQAVRGKENLAVDYRATKVEECFLLAQGWAPHETNKWRAGHFPLALRLEEGHLS